MGYSIIRWASIVLMLWFASFAMLGGCDGLRQVNDCLYLNGAACAGIEQTTNSGRVAMPHVDGGAAQLAQRIGKTISHDIESLVDGLLAAGRKHGRL